MNQTNNIDINVNSKAQNIVGAALLLVGMSAFGYYVGVRGINIEVNLNPVAFSVHNDVPVNKKVDFNTFWDAWDKAISNKSAEEQQNLYYASITGMVGSLDDPYTSFLPPQVNKAVNDAINGTYQGIGAELGFRDDQLVVVSPLDGSPAKLAGIRAGDKILAIDGVSTKGISLNEAVAKIRGPANKIVTLTIQRDDAPKFDQPLKRDNITVASVTWEDKHDGIAYMRISRFGGETNKEWTKAVNEIGVKMRELDAIIIDVRGNPGGYLQSAVYIASEFFLKKPVVYQETALGTQIPLLADRAGSFTKVPAVYVLIDGGSASASEILAGALKETINATLVGTKSFGKGTIQDAEDFKGGAGLHITIAKWLTPNKNWVHKKGIEPDVAVERTEENLKNGVDTQLDKAIELAKQI